tara:strand:+ start:1 stop:1107 length:1107 start_codon:yes stop_codon:yes gene_type:complete
MDNDDVSVMTIHQSKGMEFEYVIIPFLSSGSFPSRNYKTQHINDLPNDWRRESQLYNFDKIEEERRIFHVASTRAKKKLFLMSPEKRRSSFFKEIDENTYSTAEIDKLTYPSTDSYEYNFSYNSLVKIKFSATNLALYEQCPLAFKLNKIDKIKSKEKSTSASFGKIIHKSLERIFTTNDTSRKGIERVVNNVWDHSDFENITQSREYKKEAMSVILNYINSNPIDPLIHSLFEHDVNIEINSNSFIGKIDRIDISANGEISILDYKTSMKKKTTTAIKKNMQLGYYSYILTLDKEFDSKLPILSSLEYVRYAEDPRVSVSYCNGDMIKIKKRIDNIVESVLNNEFSPVKNSHCFFCEYKKILCPLYK